MNSVMRNMNEMVSKSAKAREMSVQYTVNVPRISFNSAASLIEEIGGNCWGIRGDFHRFPKLGFPDGDIQI